MIATVPMYRVMCDAPGCDASAQDDGDVYAWNEPEGATIEAEKTGWWLADGSRHLCPKHVPDEDAS